MPSMRPSSIDILRASDGGKKNWSAIRYPCGKVSSILFPLMRKVDSATRLSGSAVTKRRIFFVFCRGLTEA